MQRRVNIPVPVACPRCNSELTVTLDQVHEGEAVWCARCRTVVQLRPEALLGAEWARGITSQTTTFFDSA
jgi:transcription elongation factor Elf1